ncbi:MAG TPA: Imm1 family immunity protein [Pseudonocardiaceae bacterium]|jgi:hypothetical protein|nr:Imm1 family immunity protein [Pseudonocardiaceae bacterium]
MMSTAQSDALDHEELVLAALPGPDVVIQLLSEHDRRRANPAAGLCWWFQSSESADGPTLLVGVRGEVGALEWFDGAEAAAPVAGTNATRVDYFTRWGHHNDLPPGVELPIERIYAALSEFMTTEQRPACVVWGPLSA